MAFDLLSHANVQRTFKDTTCRKRTYKQITYKYHISIPTLLICARSPCIDQAQCGTKWKSLLLVKIHYFESIVNEDFFNAKDTQEVEAGGNQTLNLIWRI